MVYHWEALARPFHEISLTRLLYSSLSYLMHIAGHAEDKMRLFIIYYILSQDMSEVCAYVVHHA